MTVATIATKFTDAETAKLVEAYRASPTAETVANLAIDLGRSIASIRGKLVAEKVYAGKSAAKAVIKRETKAEILARVEVALGVVAGTFTSFDKASLEAIKALDAATSVVAEAE